MTTTAAKYTPEQVSRMSDAELSEAVGREAFGAVVVDGWPTELPSVPTLARFIEGHAVLLRNGLPLLHLGPDVPTAVLTVLERMRRRWLDARSLWTWELMDEGEEARTWVALVRSPEGWQIAATEHASLGRAVFEAALLASQEMET
jgi:hypothetical protein